MQTLYFALLRYKFLKDMWNTRDLSLEPYEIPYLVKDQYHGLSLRFFKWLQLDSNPEPFSS